MDVDETMNKELTMEPERPLQTTPVDCHGEASRAAASFNRPLQGTRPARSICNPCVPRAGMLIWIRWA